MGIVTQKQSYGYNLTLPQILAENAVKYGDTKTAIREKAYGIWQKYSWADYYRYMKKTAGGFAALESSAR